MFRVVRVVECWGNLELLAALIAEGDAQLE